MQSFLGSIRLIQRQAINSSKIAESTRSFQKNCGFILGSLKPYTSVSNEVSTIKFIGTSTQYSKDHSFMLLPNFSPLPLPLRTKSGTRTDLLTSSYNCHIPLLPLLHRGCDKSASISTLPSTSRCITTQVDSSESVAQNSSASVSDDTPPRIKFKRLDKTARHIMQILDKEAVEEVRRKREIPDIQPGYIIQLKVEVPENKRRVSILKGIVIARRNAGLNTTFRLRRLVAGVGVESLFPLYSPNIREIKVLDKKKVRRAKLYYLRDKMNALKKH